MKTDINKLEDIFPEMHRIPSDIEISQNAVMKPIAEISQLLGIKSNDLEPVSYTHLTLPTTPYV